MDPVSHRLANALVGNDRDAATLEVTLLGPELEFDDERLVAVAGAEFELTLDGRAVAVQRAVHRRRPDRGCASARAARGARAYLAVAGGIAVPPVLGSRATHLVSAMGGVDGRALVAGDRLPLGDPARVRGGRRCAAAGADGRAARSARAAFACCRARSVEYFAADALERAAVGAVHDRPAIRIAWDSGSRVRGSTHARGADIISDATPLGVAAGARVGAADPADGRSADDRRLSEDRDGDHRRHRGRRAARPRRHDCVRGLHAARSDGGADRAGTRADGRRGAAARDRLRRRRAGGVRRRPRAARTSPLAPFTTFRVGGPADWLLETRSSDEIVDGAAAGARGAACR